VEPPSYRQSSSPEVYEQQARRVSARFEQAVVMAELVFLQLKCSFEFFHPTPLLSVCSLPVKPIFKVLVPL
jgi:hypothetical protein